MAGTTAAPLVSAVSIFHNRAAAVEASVTSLLAQDYPNLEIIVVDDGSTDDTFVRLKELSDPRLEVRSQSNRGFTATLRDTVEGTSGEFVAIHDAGDLSAPSRISRQVALARSRPDVGVIGCHVAMRDEVRPLRRDHRAVIGPDPTAQLLRRNLFTHGEVLLRRRAYDAVGGYRPFFTYAQDRDLWLRLSLRTGFAVVPETLYERVRFADGVEGDPQRKLLQGYFAAFAAQCLAMRLRLGHDWIDLYGDDAGVCRGRSPELARRLWGLSLAAAGDGDLQRARWLNDLSLSERPSWRARSLGAALATSGQSSAARRGLLRAAQLRRERRW